MNSASATRDAPPPWELRSRSYVLALRREANDPYRTRSELVDARPWPLGYVMFVDYAASPVGPYFELLFIPGSFRFGARRLPSITKIYVSTQASVDNGRRNWAIPKELATFAVRYDVEGVDHLIMQVHDRQVVELAIRPSVPRLPFTTALMPRRLRTLGQTLDGRTAITAPSARALVQPAKVVRAWSDPSHFPALSPQRVAACAMLSNVKLTFPKAQG
jgi:hypothetical protein